MHTYGDLFNVTKVDLRSTFLDEKTARFLQTQKLKSLTIGTLRPSFRELYTTRNDRPRKLKIVKLLERLIQRGSGQGLRYLDLSASHTLLQEGWISKLRVMLPALRTLSLESHKFAEIEFPKFYKSFPNLQTLDISSTNVKDLDGISNLRNLRVLCLRNLEFDNYTDMIDLFGLRKLRVLDISREREDNYRNTIRYFLYCEKMLPELKFLDCSSLFLDADLYEKLTRSHPHLRKISVLGYTENLPQNPETARLTVLGTQGFDSCIETLTHYINVRRGYPVQVCLGEMLRILKEMHKKNQDYDVKKCANLLAEVTVALSENGVRSHPGTFLARPKAINCIVELAINKNIFTLGISQMFDALLIYVTGRSTFPDVERLKIHFKIIEQREPGRFFGFQRLSTEEFLHFLMQKVNPEPMDR